MKSVDIVVITYNASKYIRQSLESIFIQLIADDIKVRVVISDDFSSDDTLSIIKQLEHLSPFPFLYVEHDCNLGLTRNYQKTFGVCDADYVAVLEGDDYWCSPYHLMDHINFLEDHCECVMSVNKILVYHQRNYFESTKLEIINDASYQIVAMEDLLVWNHIVNFSSVVYRGEALRRINPKMWDVDVKNVDDWLVALELAQYGYVGKLNRYTTIYRKHDSNSYGNIDKISFAKDVNNRIDVYDHYFEFRYHEQFMKHKKANKDVLHFYKQQKIYHKVPRVIWWAIMGAKMLVRVPLLFISPRTKERIKSIIKEHVHPF